MATLESLQAKIQKLQAQAEALTAKTSRAVIEKIRGLMAEHGLTTADIDAHANGKKRGPKPGAKATAKSSASAAKYRDPKTGATWSGYGRAPGWIASAKDRSRFLVEGNAVSSAPAAKKSAKAGNYVRGPQPALYRDLKSGATWSGRGRAPAWIADAKDRSNFLIDGSSAAADAKPAAKKAVAKQGATAKKTAAKKATSAKVPAKNAVAKSTVPAAVKKASAKNAPRKAAAVPTPMAAVESGTELTT
ncbi:H-NS family nucleoid-associated regulatory protein [Paraburkholderia phenoliruptrix]|uniref:H-NS family nucleoid-associated regulatory protein n=1 Tax=Paraburkholderia phenoliruptrix TaxID=252970 RepID=UPI00285C8FC6|nr:H-NS family nucleoid-associated regulatory protein [Paraburkholderia phenoliruptrix]MDR6393006.1 DNA-binding protein H-NS [Paraburkholderia phenoliruptrix]